MEYHSDGNKVVDLKGSTAIPGLNDSHLHLIRGGLNYNLELRWEYRHFGRPADAEKNRRCALPHRNGYAAGGRLERIPVCRTPDADPGGDQRRRAGYPGLYPSSPYDRALLNRAALRVVGYTKDTPNPPQRKRSSATVTTIPPAC